MSSHDDDSIDLNEDGWDNISQTSSTVKPLWEEDPSESFSDWKIIIKSADKSDQTYHVHKSHLATGKRRCRYFSTLFALPMQTTESENSESVLELPEVCADCFPLFLNFVYEGTLDLRQDNVVPMMELARRLENRDLDQKAKDWIKKSLKEGHGEFSLLILCHSIELHMEKLQHACIKVITANFCNFFHKNESHVYVEGAGVDAVNGKYERRGSNDNVGTFCKKGLWDEKEADFMIYRSRLKSVGKLWLLTIRQSQKQSGPQDTVPYYADSSGKENEVPPAFKWVDAGKDEKALPPKIIWESTYFLSRLPFDLLIKLLGSDELYVESEDDVFDTVACLVKVMDLTHDQKNILWSCVRFSQLSKDTIAELYAFDTLPWEIVAKDLILRVGVFEEGESSASDGKYKRFNKRKCLLTKTK